MNIKDFKDSLNDVLHLNGEYLGGKVGANPNPQRDIKKLCHIMLNMCDFMGKQSIKIVALKHEVKELKKCFTNTIAPTAENTTKET